MKHHALAIAFHAIVIALGVSAAGSRLGAADSGAARTVLVRDAFVLGGERRAGAELAGKALELWDEALGPEVAWRSLTPSNAVFGASGRIVQRLPETMEARVALGDLRGGVLTVSARLYFGTEQTGDWFSIGFTTGDRGRNDKAWFSPVEETADTVLWLRLQNGRWLLCGRGTSAPAIASGDISGDIHGQPHAFAWSSPYTVFLSHDQAGRRARVRIELHGNPLVDSGWLPFGESGVAPAPKRISAAGFHYEKDPRSGDRGAGVVFIDNFEVSLTHP